jgi:hypothetical protein
MAGNAGGNRQDNRQRGNAAQLLEKYKSLARDAQLAGDRVQTEYYLQFADHYFRVLEENRSRFEDQQPQRRRRDEEDDEIDGDEEMTSESDDGDDEGEAEVRQRPNRDRPRDRERGRERFERQDRPQQSRANGARRDEEEAEERISLGVLPPAIGAAEGEEEAEAPKPRRRAVRKPRADDDDVAPAA